MRPLLRLFAFCGPALAALPAAAALPPQYQRVAELKAVIADLKVAQAFGATSIERVEYVRDDFYRVSAGPCHLDVAIVDLPTPRGIAGPRRFGVKAGPKMCRK